MDQRQAWAGAGRAISQAVGFEPTASSADAAWTSARLYAWRGRAHECAFPQFDQPVLVYHTGGAAHVPVLYRGRDHAASHPGHFTFIPQDTPITWQIGGDVHSYSLHLIPGAFERLLEQGGEKLVAGVRLKCGFTDGLLAEMVETMAAEALRPTQLGSLLVDSMVDSIALCLARASVGSVAWKPDAGGLPRRALQAVMEMIDANLETGISLQALADEVGLSRAHFVTAFRRAVGTTPHRFLTQRRIDVAQHKLLSSTAAIADIALACGFSSQAHFTDCFRRLSGTTPAAWRLRRQ